LKNIKLNGWDEEFIRRIKFKRDEELDYTKKNLNIQIIKSLLNSNLFLILMLFSLNFYMEKNEDIEISSLSTSIQLVHSMTFPIMAIPSFLNMLYSNFLSFDRLQNFLFTEDHKGDNNLNINELNENNTLIKFENATFGIKNKLIKKKRNFTNHKLKKNRNPIPNNKNEEIELKEMLIDNKEGQKEDKNNLKNMKNESISINIKDKKFTNTKDIILIKNISLSVRKGEFIAVLGPTGSGKTSLLNSIMNNFHLYSSNSPIIINGELSYYSQQPWILSDTIKNNILFFKEYDKKKYKKILSICQLDYDLELLSYGNNTEINSTSISVSGGQKARISLARCLYKDADLYLIDDPFSSIDNKIGKKIFKDAFCDYLKDKAKILVTNE
jgi:ABC-type multidrug transport system fused ATPase/permease subunit